MQNKGLIRFLTWAFVIACLFQLTFTFATSSVERKAKKAAEFYVNTPAAQAEIKGAEDQMQAQETLKNKFLERYLDSMATEKVWLGYTYRECQSRELGLGLDLKGGMNVMLEVSTSDVVKALAGDSYDADATFHKAIDNAIEAQKKSTNRDFVSIFYDEIKKLDPDVKLAGYFSSQLRDQISLSATNDDVIKVVKAEASSAYDRTYEVLRQRIDKFGVAQPNIQQLRASERILVELPGVKEPERVRKLLQGTAQLEFWSTYECSDAIGWIQDANRFAASIRPEADTATTVAEETKDAEADSNALLDQLTKSDGNTEAEASEQDKKENPILSRMSLNVDPSTGQVGRGPVIGYAMGKDRDIISEYIAKAFDAKKIDKRRVKFLWGAKPQKGTDVYALYAIKVAQRDGTALLDGGVITDARQDFSAAGGNEISMTMNDEGARKWKRITGENVGKCVAIVLDDIVYSAPVVNGEIAGGRSSITGDFTLDEAKDLANILKSGKLPARAVIVSEAVVGPSLGQESINNGLLSFILAFLIVLVYMWVFYNRAGLVSIVALITNVFLLIGILVSLGSVLTLPGIAGIVLTMAMAVDGNVIIYERIKEELHNGASLSNAVETGFKNAYSAIIDGQVTTFLLGLVLIMFGSGAVRGFAVTLCIGIVTSLFTSIFITRLCIDAMLKRKKEITFSHKFSENFLQNVHIDFIGRRKTFYIIAAVAIVICIASFCFRGMSLGIDFTGGRTYVVRFDQSVNVQDVRTAMAAQFEEAPEVKTYGPSSQVKVTTKYKIKEDGDEVKAEIINKLYAAAKPFYKADLSVEQFRSTESDPRGIIQEDQVGGTIAHDNLMHSIWAVIGGLIVMFVYIAFRFKSWRFGVGSVAALTHDTILVIGLFSLLWGLLPFSLDVDQYFISALLTVIGYSINATVVIFDRVREFKALYPKRDLFTHMNDAINSTLARTVNTSGTTFFTLLMMFIFGGEVIRGFIFALLVGVLVGVFSSVCIACAVVYEISKKEAREETKAVKA